MNNAESKSEQQQDHEIAQNKSTFVRHCQEIDTQTTYEFDDQQKNREHFSDQQNSKTNESQSAVDLYTRNLATNLSGRNKRKNFNPRPTTIESNSNSTMNSTSSYKNQNSSRMLRNNISEPSKSRPLSLALSIIPTASSSSDRGYFSESLDLNTVSQLTQYNPWLQMFSQYEQLVKAAGLKAHNFQQTSSVNNGHQFAPEMSEWIGKFGSSESAATAIRDILKAYQGKAEWDKLHSQHQDGNGSSVNLSTETEPPTPPTTPQTTCHSSSRSVLANGNNDPPPYQPPEFENSHIKKEVQNSSSPSPPQPNAEYTKCFENNHWNKVSEQISNQRDCEVDDEDDNERSAFAQSSHDEGLDYGRNKGEGEGQAEAEPNSHQNIRECCEDFQKIDKTIKNECDDTETTIDDDGDCDDYVESNIYDEEDYPPRSPNDFPDSSNAENDENDNDDDGDDDDDDSYSSNMFCDDEHSEADDQQTQHHHHQVGVNYSTESDRTDVTPTLPDIANPDHHENTNLIIAERDSTCSNSSSRISVRNLGGLYEQGQMNLNPSKLRSGIDEKTMHPDFIQNMNKFTSYLECLNEMCRLENLREHYHCNDYPCFGKILSKKEEVIRHVKWHRKRMESLNHGFMRFSSSDDCSATFGVHCQHNRKQTHYHCFQPNCDRVYISTSDVQMHSNFHRKDSAIHKEGFQRFRANEKCSVDYCMFAGQKTTHFHCRRDNCRYTFKNKADMEKHKTYHIKDLKLARDGFKKFLKNEACPYKQCKFSKVCNHIHCARENCFYVLHSSGQLLSHKRKHERIDNEQTYCRYKMLAVKAALMGNPSAAATTASTTAEMPAFNFGKSLMQLKDLESNSFSPRSSSDTSNFLSTPKQESIFRNKDDESPDASASIMSMEFLQQMKKRHEEILNQKTHHQAEILNETGSGPEVSMFPIIRRTNSPTQYDMALQPSHLTPTVIEQFFTSECPAMMAKKSPVKDDQPVNMKCTPERAKDCPWKDHPEPHLHCILKGCEAVTPNNILDISAHIRMHGYNRDVYAATIGAAPSPTASSSNPMQITTIDGFFNRKRGRPPKNRFVEVYKNAQQSPQAIFTSFKLEKQTAGKESLDPSAAASGHQHCFDTSASFIAQHQKQKKEEPALNQNVPFPTPTTSSQFVIYNQNENCEVADSRCPLTMQQHYHCASAADCTFVTMERDVLRTHLERQHTATSYADTISKKFIRYDRNIGLDCGIFECRLRKTRPHLHCRQCSRQISPFDLESHVCGETTNEPRPSLSISPPKKMSAASTYSSSEFTSNEQQSSAATVGGKNIIRDYSRLPSVTFSTLNELRRKVSEMEPEGGCSGTKRSHEEEKVLVVRAAGTYFPENTSDLSKTPSPAQQRPPGTTETLHTPPITPSNVTHCSTPYCKKSRRPHDHCDTCEQAFVDPVKWRASRLKQLQATNQPIPFHLSHFLEPDESKPASYHKAPTSYYDEQPQDLSLYSNTTITAGASLDERMKLYRESFPASPPATLPSQLNPTPGHLLNYFPQDLMSSVSIQNFHLAQLATLYQQNPYYYQHLYPFLSNTVALSRHQQQNRPTAQEYRTADSEDKPTYRSASTESLKSPPSSSNIPALHPGSSKHFPFLNPLLLVRPPMELTQSKPSQIFPSKSTGGLMPSPSAPKFEAAKVHKRKLTNGNEEYSTLIDALLPSTKKQVQFATGLAAPPATHNSSPNQPGGPSSSTRSTHEQHAQHFKIRDEQIPNGYLKFRFNEDCFFLKCGYRNHQSHFHCDRNDCHYSFCDKTRFVQHTARHERLDKLMGNDFRQYRANMSCGYENCPYYKNLGSANKSSHFHCLKCEFICSDTNKVVAHRRQHNKMEYIRMAGFRKVTNSEKCDSTFEATVPTNGNELPGTVECSYSQKQTHYHCLVCDVSVLSKAQLGSHKHKT